MQEEPILTNFKTNLNKSSNESRTDKEEAMNEIP